MAVGGKVPFTLQVTVLDEGKAGKELRAGTEVDATEGHCLQLLPLAFSLLSYITQNLQPRHSSTHSVLGPPH